MLVQRAVIGKVDLSRSTGLARKEKRNAVVPLTGWLVWNAQQRWPILLHKCVTKRLAGRGMYSTLWDDGRYNFGAGVGTSSIRMVFIHSAVMLSRSTIDIPA